MIMMLFVLEETNQDIIGQMISDVFNPSSMVIILQ